MVQEFLQHTTSLVLFYGPILPCFAISVFHECEEKVEKLY